jgi:hypothetical protein
MCRLLNATQYRLIALHLTAHLPEESGYVTPSIANFTEEKPRVHVWISCPSVNIEIIFKIKSSALRIILLVRNHLHFVTSLVFTVRGLVALRPTP